ncbi:hypothetical protein A2160_04630 [Candidatus Beckwithbacteria bacterium RBG_13_42_9]|uniref:Uncharacterized protein n=1 Tax=Candidatus Beckwithbacteria bacterium RBG_13_42_9 TaxID=1797457 RepID=A0A1F5E439_9BACT|nr:MAG: hypothetical protein A2160_04630 [Candidatus Beckwithbacteria bacterium RBG_13_42_9]
MAEIMKEPKIEVVTIACEPSHGPIVVDGVTYWTAIMPVDGKLCDVLTPVEGGEQIIMPFVVVKEGGK